MPSQRRLRNMAVAAGLVLPFASSLPGQTKETVVSPPTLQETECPFEAGPWVQHERVVCGHVTVPESRGRSSSRTLRITVVVLPSRHPDPEADPVV